MLCTDREMGILFSGGIDSTIVAVLAAEMGGVRLYTAGVAGAHDLRIAEETAEALGFPWEGIEVSEDQVVRSVVPLATVIGTEHILPISFEMPAFLVMGLGKEKSYLSGQGADELFGGYMRYLSMPPDRLRDAMRGDLEVLLGGGVSLEKAVAHHYAKEICHPYLDPAVVRFASSLTASDCVKNGMRKAVLVQVASILGLDFLATRQKKAAQYGSGVMNVLKTAAKERGVPVSSLPSALRSEGKAFKG